MAFLLCLKVARSIIEDRRCFVRYEVWDLCTALLVAVSLLINWQPPFSSETAFCCLMTLTYTQTRYALKRGLRCY